MLVFLNDCLNKCVHREAIKKQCVSNMCHLCCPDLENYLCHSWKGDLYIICGHCDKNTKFIALICISNQKTVHSDSYLTSSRTSRNRRRRRRRMVIKNRCPHLQNLLEGKKWGQGHAVKTYINFVNKVFSSSRKLEDVPGTIHVTLSHRLITP